MNRINLPEPVDTVSSSACGLIFARPCAQSYFAPRKSFVPSLRAPDFVSLQAAIFRKVEHFVIRYHKIVNMMRKSNGRQMKSIKKFSHQTVTMETLCVYPHLFIIFRKAFTVELIYNLSNTNNVAWGIFDGHTQQCFGSISGLHINVTIESFILRMKGVANKSKYWTNLLNVFIIFRMNILTSPRGPCEFKLNHDKGTHLICIWYIHRFATFRNMTSDTGAPCHTNFVLFFHFFERAPRAHIEQFRHEASEVTNKVNFTSFIAQSLLGYSDKLFTFYSCRSHCRQCISLAPKTVSRDLLSAISKRFGEFCDKAIVHRAHCIYLLPSGKKQRKTKVIELNEQSHSYTRRLTNSKINCFSSKCLSSFRDSRWGRWWWLDVELIGLVVEPDAESLCE